MLFLEQKNCVRLYAYAFYNDGIGKSYTQVFEILSIIVIDG